MLGERVVSLPWLRKQLEEAHNDLLPKMVKAVVEMPMGGEADRICGAPYKQSSAFRDNHRNVYRQRWGTRVDMIGLAIPHQCKGGYFPEWLLDSQHWWERALMQATESYVRGVSTWRVGGSHQGLGLDGLSL